MIAKLKGIIDEIQDNKIIIDVCGVFYEVISPNSTILNLQIGSNVTLLIQQIIREDANNLYGFLEQNQKTWFNHLIKVSGLGPKFAINILSILSCDEIIIAIKEKDEAQLSRANGVGKKLATKIIAELASLTKNMILPINGNITQIQKISNNSNSAYDAINALLKLGFQRNNVTQVVDKILSEHHNANIEEIIKEALIRLSS